SHPTLLHPLSLHDALPILSCSTIILIGCSTSSILLSIIMMLNLHLKNGLIVDVINNDMHCCLLKIRVEYQQEHDLFLILSLDKKWLMIPVSSNINNLFFHQHLEMVQ